MHSIQRESLFYCKFYSCFSYTFFLSGLQYFFAAYDFCRLRSAVRLTTTYAVSTMVPVRIHEIG